jgi:peptidoglycan/LPS O-acetylase OafA/YrhL
MATERRQFGRNSARGKCSPGRTFWLADKLRKVKSAMIRWFHRRWLAAIVLIAGAAVLQGCVYGPYGGYPGYAPGYGYPGYGYPAGGAVVVAPGGYYHGGYGGGDYRGGYGDRH